MKIGMHAWTSAVTVQGKLYDGGQLRSLTAKGC
jgi:hypothetical protein